LQNQAKNSAFNHRFYNLFSDILSSAVFKQAYRLGQLAFPQVGGWFTQNSAIDNTKVKTEDNFVENRNLKTKTELFTSSFLRQIYRFGQLAKLQVGGWFARNSASKKAQALIKNSIQGTRNVRSVGQMRRKFLTTCTIKGTQGGNLQADVPQYGRSLPICAKDTPHFWSEVYKLGIKNFIQGTLNFRSVGQMCRKFLTTCTIKGTQGGNLQAGLVQGGRSMIEMLGVLAIIGVLSVGGIAGYSKAMTKFKINKTIDLVSQIAANTRTLFASQEYDFSCRWDSTSLCQKAKIVPDDAIQNGYIKNPFGGTVWIAGGIDDFTVELYDIPEDACMELATLDWSAATSSGLNALGVNQYVTATVKNCDGNNDGLACVGGKTLSVPVPVSVAAQRCSGNNNFIHFQFY
jgi:type II secretory pathway pseudopilin PulG